MSEQGYQTEAVSSDVEIQEWQINEIEEGLREADAGDFASDEEVATVFAKWMERPISS
jgi:predicted transcriptional regulator